MELRHLRYFIAVAGELNFCRAAERLRLTQPALSRQIRDLEEELGVELFHRRRTRTALTPAGVRFAASVRDILAATDRAADEARSIGSQIRLGHYGSLWLDYFSPALARFAKAHPGFRLAPVELTPRELATAVAGGQVDFALLGPFDSNPAQGLEVRRVAALPAVVALAASNPLAKRRRLSLADLAGTPWLSWDEHDFPGRHAIIADAARRAHLSPRWASPVNSMASVFLEIADSGTAAFVLPMSKKLPHAGVVFSELKGQPVVFPMDVAWRSRHPHAATLGNLAATLSASSRPRSSS